VPTVSLPLTEEPFTDQPIHELLGGVAPEAEVSPDQIGI
jgi:hypothetical protein